MLKIGDTVQWRGGFGDHAPLPAVIKLMEVTENPREKGWGFPLGKQVTEVDLAIVRQNRVVFTFESGNWAYSEQIDLPETLESLNTIAEKHGFNLEYREPDGEGGGDEFELFSNEHAPGVTACYPLLDNAAEDIMRIERGENPLGVGSF